jgi:hypothetical protein
MEMVCFQNLGWAILLLEHHIATIAATKRKQVNGLRLQKPVIF